MASTEQLKFKLKNDPAYIISFIVDNNTSAVIDKLSERGYVDFNNDDSIFLALNDIVSRNGVADLIDVLSVPFDQTKLTAEQIQILLDVSAENINKYSPTLNADGYATRSLAGIGEEGIGVDNILTGLAAGLSGLFGGGNTGYMGQATAYNPYNPYNNNNNNQNSSTWVWVAVIVGVIILAVILFFAFRKK